MNKRFHTILLTSFLTAFFLLAGLASGLYFYFPQTSNGKTEHQARINLTPTETPLNTRRRQKTISVKASEIRSVTFSLFSHVGLLLSGSDESFAATNVTSFSSDGTAQRLSGKIDYDTRQKPSSSGIQYRGSVTEEQFAGLAEVIVDSDFLNEEDSVNIISDTSDNTLSIAYTGGTKQIKTSNINQDTPEVQAILRAFGDLQSQIDWKEEK